MDLSASIHLLGTLLGEVITAQERPALFEVEERIRAHAKDRRAGVAGSERMSMSSRPSRMPSTATSSAWSATGARNPRSRSTTPIG